jgi:ribonucleoside-diphosphate reductase alpha chain
VKIEQWLDTQLGIDIWNKKYQFKNEDFEYWLDRVSNKDKKLRQLIMDKKFLFGGRALTNRNTDESGSMFNCYSSGFAPDDYDKLLELNKNLGKTYKAQGGQGVSMSKLRPKGTPIGKRFKSDGIVPFMEIFNCTTKETSQGGSRKGALMISLDIRHKEAETFITIKSVEGKIEKANLSLEIDDEFMEAVETYYKTGEVITLHEKRDYSGHIVEYDIIPINLYKLLVSNCYEWADPACLFTNRFRNYNLMELDNEYNIETSNPCGEQPLPPDFCCNLGSLNLAEYVINPFAEDSFFDMDSFTEDIYIAVKALDDIIDENANNHPLQTQKDNSINYRNIGLGVFGYASALMKLRVTYGSEQAKKWTNLVFELLFKEAVKASVQLAKEKGTFPKFKSCIFDSEIIRKHFTNEEIKEFKKYGIRNCSLISIAPTGSIATMLGETGGCEPEFAISYKRKTESLDDGKEKIFDVFCRTAQEYINITKNTELPKYFISSADINWKDRVEIQAIMQEHVDTAISSTVNLPESATIEEIEQLYLYAWRKGLKGITIFRNGCKRAGILSTSSDTSTEKNNNATLELPRGYIEEVPKDLAYRKYKLKNGCGNLYFFVGVDEIEGKIYDVFTNTDAVGGCSINTQANSRLLSAGLRGGIPVEYLIEQLEKSGSCASYQSLRGKQLGMAKVRNMILKEVSTETINKIDELIGTPVSAGKSCPSSIAVVLKNIIKEFEGTDYESVKYDIATKKEIEEIKNNNDKLEELKLDECQHKNMRMTEGCMTCPDCGFSKCG